jgi:hypothetical protein
MAGVPCRGRAPHGLAKLGLASAVRSVTLSIAADHTGERAASSAVNACRAACSARGLRVQAGRYALSVGVTAPHWARRRIACRGRTRSDALVAIGLAAQIRGIGFAATVRARREGGVCLGRVGDGVGIPRGRNAIGKALRVPRGGAVRAGGVSGCARVSAVSPAARRPDQHQRPAHEQRCQGGGRMLARASHALCNLPVPRGRRTRDLRAKRFAV